MDGHRNRQPQVQLIAAVIWNDIPSRRPLIGRIRRILHADAFFDTSTVTRNVPCQQPRSNVGNEPTAMAYKAGEGTPQ